MDFGDNWQEYFEILIADAIQQEAVFHSISEFFEKRIELNQLLYDKLKSAMSLDSKNLLLLVSINIQRIEVDNELESAIESKLVQMQKLKIYYLDDKIFAINKNTERLARQMKSDIEQLNLNANSYYQSSKINSHSKCLNIVMSNDANVYSEMNNVLFNGDSQLINIISILEQSEYQPAQYFNFEKLNINDSNN